MAKDKTQVTSTQDVDTTVGNHTPVNPAGETSRNDGPIVYVGVAGNVKVKTIGGQDALFLNVPAGTWMPVQVQLIYKVGTTATNLILCW